MRVEYRADDCAALKSGAGKPPLYFAGSQKPAEDSDSVELSQQPQQPGRLRRIGRKILLVSPLASLLGGAALMTSAFLPSHHAVNTSSPPVAVASAHPQATPQQQDAINNIKDILFRLGWTLGAIGTLTGGINGLSAGYSSKQPSMALGSIGQILAAPILVADPTVSARAALMTAIALFITGFANKMRNDFGLRPGEAPRELDMSPLVHKQALEQLVGNDDPSAMQLARAWAAQASKTLRFVGGDQVLMLTHGAKSIGHAAIHPKETLARQKKAIAQFSQFVRRRRKEMPDFMKPSATQGQVGAMLMYLGSVPLLFLSGSIPVITDIGTKLIAAGSLTENTSLFAVGMNDGKFPARALLIGVPMMTLGNAELHTDAGAAATMLASATYANFFRSVADEARRVSQE